MGEGTNIDSLQIEISATSTDATEKVNNLVVALKNLKDVLKGGFGRVPNVFGDGGKPTGGTGRTGSGVDGLSKKLKSLNSIKLKLADQLSETGIQALKISSTIDDMQRKLQSIRDVGPFQTGTNFKIQDAEDSVTNLTTAYNTAREAAEKLEEINNEIAKAKFDTSAPGESLYIQDYIERATEALKNYKEALNDVKLAQTKAQTSLTTAQAGVGVEKNFAKNEVEQIKRIRDSIKSLNSLKLNLEDKLKSAELQAVKTDGRIDDMRRKLESVKNTENIGEEAKKSIQNAEAKMNQFANAANSAKERVSDLRSALDTLRSYTPDFSKTGTLQEIEESRAELNDLIKAYKDAQAAVQLYGEQAKNAMAEATAATREAARAAKGDVGKKQKDSDTGYAPKIKVEGGDNGDLKSKVSVLGKIRDILSDIGSAKITGGLKGLQGTLSNLIPAGASSAVKALGTAFEVLGTTISEVVSSHPAVFAVLTALGILIMAVKKAVDALWGGMKKFAQSSVKAAKVGLDLLAGAADKAKEALNGLKNVLLSIGGKALGAIASGAKAAGKNLVDRFTKPFTNAIKTFKEWKNAIGRIALYRAIRSAVKAVTDGFKTGINNLYEYSRLVGTEFAPAMDRLATSALYLKNSLGAMAAPLIQALAPAIDFIIDKFVALLNVIGKVFAVLTGKDVYTQAKRHAVEYGDAAKKANKATKDFVLGIDELNIINDAVSNASSAADDFGSMFEEVEIGSDFDWVREIKEAIENGKWGEAGKLLAKKLNEIINVWDSYEWGRKLGEKLKHGLEFAYGFLKEFDFRRLGQKIGDLILGIMDGLGMEGFELIGRTLAAGVNGAFSFLAGLLDSWEPRVADMGRYIASAINGWFDEIDWAMIAETISRGIIFVANLAEETFKNIEWENIGADFAEFLNNINWYGIITSIADAIIEGFNGLKRLIDTFLSKWDWKDTANQIYTAINESIVKIDAYGWGKTLGDVFVRAFNFLKDVIAGINWYEIGEKIAQLILGFNFVEALGSLADLLAAGINASIFALQGFLDNILPQAFEIARGIAERIKIAVMSVEWGSLGVAIGDGIKAALSFVAGLLDPDLFYEIGVAIGDFLVNIDWPGIFEALGTAIANGINSAVSFAIGLLDVIEPNVEAIASGIAQKINEFIDKVKWEDLGNAIARGINTAVKFVLTLLKKVEWKSIWEKAIELINKVINEVEWDKVGKAFGEMLKLKIEGVTTFLEKIDWAGIVRAIVDFLTGVDWIGIAADITKFLLEMIGAAVDGVIGWITGSPKIKLIGAEIVAGILLGIVQSVIHLPMWLKEHLIDPLVNGVKGLLGIHSPSTVFAEIGGYIIEGLFKGISDTWHTIIEFFSTKLEELKQVFSDTWENIKETVSSKLELIKSDIAKKWEFIKSDTSQKLESIKSDVSQKWESIKSDTAQKLETIRSDVSQKWELIKSEIAQKLAVIVENIAQKWEQVKLDTIQKWESIKSTLSNTWESIKSNAVSAFEGIKSAISNAWRGITESARNWGSDMANNIASGIRSAYYTVSNAVSGLANNVRSYLHFSEPDVGPLSDFHTYMPDMIDLMVSGIKNSEYKAANAAADLASAISNAMSDVEPVQLQYSSPPNIPYATLPVISAAGDISGMSVRNYSESRISTDNGDVVNALYAVASKLVEAINENGDRPISIDGRTLMNSVEKAQYERGANIMGGGGLF